jgi:glucose/arabinose dehydrogenase
MKRALAALLAAVLLQIPLSVSVPVPAAHAVSVTAIASNLDFPAAMSFLPAGRIVYGERFTGEVRFLDPATLSNTLVWTFTNVATAGEQGLLSVVSHPNYPASPFLYAYVTRTVNGQPQNQIIRVRVANGVGTSQLILTRIKAGTIHNGGTLRFGPSGRLHVVTGEIGVPANAQNTATLLGKVLRLTADGKAAPGNPFGNKVFSYGHRNMFGIDIDPRTGSLWVSENGPGCNDELNKIVAGGNFAWGPNQSCGVPPDAEDTNRDGPQPRRFPKALFNPTIAPTGVAFCDGCGLGTATEGALLMGAWNDGTIRRSTLSADRQSITSTSIFFDHNEGVLSVVAAPNGRIYFSDPNQIFILNP